MTVNRPSFNANTYFECHKDHISSNYFFFKHLGQSRPFVYISYLYKQAI